MSTKKRTTKTRDEVKDEFDTVVDRHTSSKTTMSSKETEALRVHQAEVLAKVAQLTPDKVIGTVAAVQLDVTKTLSQVSEILVEKTQQLQEVNEAIKIREEELERLHGVDVVASAIDTLLEQYKETKERLEQEQADARLAWAKERDRHEDEEAERQAQQKKDREREEAEYKYNFAQRCRAAEDTWNEQAKQRGKQLAEHEENLKKGWLQREEALKAQEAEVTKLKQEAQEWPAKLDAEVKKQVSIATNTQKRDYEHQIQLMQAQAASTENLLRQKNQQLEHSNAQLLTQIEQLQAKLADANEKVTAVAQKALESASGQSALAAVQKFASEAGSNGPMKRS